MTKGIDPLFPPKQREGWGEVIREFVPGIIGASEYVKAFERNCPGVRLTQEEREELRRLFSVAANNPTHD